MCIFHSSGWRHASNSSGSYLERIKATAPLWRFGCGTTGEAIFFLDSLFTHMNPSSPTSDVLYKFAEPYDLNWTTFVSYSSSSQVIANVVTDSISIESQTSRRSFHWGCTNYDILYFCNLVLYKHSRSVRISRLLVNVYLDELSRRHDKSMTNNYFAMAATSILVKVLTFNGIKYSLFESPVFTRSFPTDLRLVAVLSPCPYRKTSSVPIMQGVPS